MKERTRILRFTLEEKKYRIELSTGDITLYFVEDSDRAGRRYWREISHDRGSNRIEKFLFTADLKPMLPSDSGCDVMDIEEEV